MNSAQALFIVRTHPMLSACRLRGQALPKRFATNAGNSTCFWRMKPRCGSLPSRNRSTAAQLPAAVVIWIALKGALPLRSAKILREGPLSGGVIGERYPARSSQRPLELKADCRYPRRAAQLQNRRDVDCGGKRDEAGRISST